MSETGQQQDLSATVIDGFNQQWYDETKANDGASFTRHPIGDYRGKIKEIEVKASEKAEKPHNMIVVTVETTGVGRDGDKEAIGQTIVTRYGTPQSPKFMQQRTANLCKALDLRGPFAPKSLVGRELEYTIVWEKGDPTTNSAGEEKIYVNSRLQCERKVGAPPPKVNAKAQSAAALKYLASELDLDGGADDKAGTAAPAGDTPAWAQGGTAGTAGAATTASTAAASTFLPEAQVPPAVHQYRAAIAMGVPQADAHRKTLIAKNINPDGPIDAVHLPEKMRADFQAFLAKQGDGALPDLDGATNGAAAPKTGTRTKQSTAAA